LFRSNQRGQMEFFEVNALSGGTQTPVLSGGAQLQADISTLSLVPFDITPDDKHAIFGAMGNSGWDLWLLPLDPPGKPVPFLSEPFDQIHASFSPDGHLIAYSSDESGKFEVYVQTFPSHDRKWQVSTNGGYEPHW